MPAEAKMEHLVVHRIVEQHAATSADAPAIVCDGGAITYRDLNVRANGIARRLLEEGFRRGAHLTVAMDHGIDLATVLLAVLKAGGSYAWRPGHPAIPQRHALLATGFEPAAAGHRPRTVDLDMLLRESTRTSPNLPVLTRPADLACVLTSDGGRHVLVPHSTIAALRHERPASAQASRVWDGEPSSFELWAGLMSGATLDVLTAPALLDAA